MKAIGWEIPADMRKAFERIWYETDIDKGIV